MRGRLSGSNGEGGVEEKDALAGPVFEIAVVRSRYSEVVAQFLEDVAQ